MITFALLFLIPAPVSLFDLGNSSEKYHGRIVRIEVVLEGFDPSEKWHHSAGAKGAEYIEAIGQTKPDATNGDKVAILGVFRFKPNTFSPRIIHNATMEKIPFDVTPAQLRGREFEGRLVRVEDEVDHVRVQQERQIIELKARPIDIEWPGKIAQGDRVRVTGIFMWPPRNSFENKRILQPVVEKMEKK